LTQSVLNTFKKLRDEISLNQRENVEKNVKLYVDSFIKEYKNIKKDFFFIFLY